jgi:hypothetical protein
MREYEERKNTREKAIQSPRAKRAYEEKKKRNCTSTALLPMKRDEGKEVITWGKKGKRIAVTPTNPAGPARRVVGEAALNATSFWNLGRVRSD